MKNTEAEKNALERMRPGAITIQGFLGTDTRSLADIIEADAEEFRRLKLDPEEAQMVWSICVMPARQASANPSPWKDAM
jgi:hypothetical protein